MSIPRVFIPQQQINKEKEQAVVIGSDVHYLKSVMRKKVGDQVQLFNSIGQELGTKIVEMQDDKIVLKILNMRNIKSEMDVKITLAQSLPKSSKMDFIVQKATELGVSRIIPFVSERTVVKINKEKAKDRVVRWRRIVKEAAEQSARVILPEVDEVVDFSEVLNMTKEYDLNLFAWEGEKETGIKKLLQENKKIKNIMLVIGGEGGFSSSEAEQAKNSGFSSVHIGRHIMRTETAPLAILAMLKYEFEL